MVYMEARGELQHAVAVLAAEVWALVKFAPIMFSSRVCFFRLLPFIFLLEFHSAKSFPLFFRQPMCIACFTT